MPTSIQGFGTAWYGQSDYRADGSYVTTEWVVAALLPLIPLRSLRVNPNLGPDQAARDLRDSWPGMYRKQTYLIESGGVKLNWLQVLRTYAFLGLLSLWGYVVWALAESVIFGGQKWFFFALLASFSLPSSIPFLLRRRARSRVRGLGSSSDWQTILMVALFLGIAFAFGTWVNSLVDSSALYLLSTMAALVFEMLVVVFGVWVADGLKKLRR